MTSESIPRAFIWRRLHSLMGLWLVLFLFEHLLINSQAALLLGDNARGFVALVNALHNLPYLQAIEIFLLGVPFAIHAVLGIKYLFTTKFNSRAPDGAYPDMHQYGRNRAYTWQRITSWILLVGIISMSPNSVSSIIPTRSIWVTESYFVTVSVDKGLYTVASRLGVDLYGPEQIKEQKEDFEYRHAEQTLVEVAQTLQAKESTISQQQMILTSAQAYEQKRAWLKVLENKESVTPEVVAVSSNFGTATLLSVRDTFKSPHLCGAVYDFCFGCLLPCLQWILDVSYYMGRCPSCLFTTRSVEIAWSLMALIAFFGLAAIWGTYFLNLKT